MGVNSNNSNRKRKSKYIVKSSGSGSGGGDTGGNPESNPELAQSTSNSDTSGDISQVSDSGGEAASSDQSARVIEGDFSGGAENPGNDSSSGSTGDSGRTRGSGSSNGNRSGKTPRNTSRRTSQENKRSEKARDPLRPNVIDFDTARSAREFAIKIEDLQKILLTGSSVIAKFAGEHWEFTNSEATELAKALKALPMGRDSWIVKFLSKNQPYFNFVLVAGSILAPRAFISYQLAREKQVYATSARQQANSQESQEFFDGSNGQGWTPNANGSWYQNLSAQA